MTEADHEPTTFTRLTAALRPDAPAMTPASIEASLASLAPIREAAETAIDEAALQLERCDAFGEELRRRLESTRATQTTTGTQHHEA